MVDPDIDLLNAVGRGEHGAFEILVTKYQGPILNFIARYTGDRYMAEDIAQEVFLRIYRAAPRFQAKTKASTWIFRIAYNQALTEMGRQKRQRSLCEAIIRSKVSSDKESLSQPDDRLEFEEEIASAIGKLPDNQRAALLLRVNEDLSYREIAEVLDVSVQSVESLLFRARTSIRKYLDKIRKG